MNLEYQVCTLEQAKRLKELGIEQHSFWFYGNDHLITNRQEYYLRDDKEGITERGCGCCEESMETKELYSAFTVAELANLLLPHDPSIGYFIFYNTTISSPMLEVEFTERTLAEAMAKMLIYLIEQGLYTL